jgi:DNA-binding PadR family transcriptional regulator
VTSRDARAKLRRTIAVRRVADYLLTHPAGDYGGAIAQATGLSPQKVTGAKGVLRRLVAAGYATRKVEQVDPAEINRPRRIYYRLTEAGRLWAAAAARLVVWRRTINLEAGTPVTVSILYLPTGGGGESQGQEAWRVELSGELSRLTAGDASNLALLLEAAAEEVVATGQPPASSRDHRRMRRMRGQEPPDIGPLADEGTWVLGAVGSVARGAGRLPSPQIGLESRGNGAGTVSTL